MIRVEGLVKRFYDRAAVDGVTFEVQKGEILGFLGPNGAGKTTTMRILTGFLPPTSGRAEVAGFDVTTRSLEVRRHIGYLPESVPMYPEMRVTEYLDYRARLKGVPRRNRPQQIDEALSRCGLADVRSRIIGQLSKGYRQRVGLADALVHKPPILILDEPTVGLDPNQIRDVRELIRELGREHTIILSTHILPEVEMVCTRVAIIHRGKIVAQDTAQRLRAQVERRPHVRVQVRGPADEVSAVLAAVPGVERVELITRVGAQGAAAGADEIATFAVEGSRDRDVREDLAQAIYAQGATHGWRLRDLHLEELSLEDVFYQITKEEAVA